MAWLQNGKTLRVGKSFADDEGFKHPYNWVSIYSPAYKKKWGITWQDEPDTSYDARFYTAKDIERKIDDLKATWIATTKTTAKSLLQSTDWYVTRKAEVGTAIPSDVTKFRTAVRDATVTIEKAINACSELDGFKALFDTPKDGGNAVIYNFPESI